MKKIDLEHRSEILVTGATGLSGSLVIKEFIRQNIPVRALVRNLDKARQFEGNSIVEIVEGNMLKPETLHDALQGVKKALVISSAYEDMVKTQETFIDAAKAAGVPHLVKYSGAAAGIGFNNENFKPAIEHLKIEDYLIDSGLKWTIIRPSQFMQLYLPGTHSGVDLAEDALILPIKNAMETPVAVEDVAKACVALLTQEGHESRFYEMTGPDAMTMTNACEIISDVIGRKISYRDINFDDYRSRLTKLGFSSGGVELLTQLSKERIKSIESYVRMESHQRLGIRPTNFAEFIFRNRSAFQLPV